VEYIIHRINKIKTLSKLPCKYGVEIDVRSYKSKIILNHEPKMNGDSFIDYLSNYKHGTLIFNIKEAGIEKEVIDTALNNNIKSFFLLDVEHPFLITSGRIYKRYLACRYSEYEPIELFINFKKFTNWLWIDTINKLPITSNKIPILKKFKTCIVSPERWGRAKDIHVYKKFFNRHNFFPTAIMTDQKCLKIWES
tara:strand:+ start:850 stop:1434 length:585 start_codon:yes stop_codon:yes gene_type:complete